jgi:hypothetical protein
MCCPDKDKTRLLIKNVNKLEKWMEADRRTDPELIYWIPKYILMRNNKPFSHMGHMSAKMGALAERQDKIGWRNFTEGYISCHFYNIQCFHLSQLDQNVHLQDPTDNTFTMDISKHLPP